MPAGVLQDLAVVIDVKFDPALDRLFSDALVLIHQAADDHLPHFAQPGAGGTGAGWLVEGKVRHAHLRHRGTAVRTGIGAVRAFVGLRVERGLPGLVIGLIGGRRHILSTIRTGTVSEACIQDAQVGKDLGDRTHRRAGTVVSQVLVDADGWRQADDRIDRGLAEAPCDQTERLE